MITLENGFKVYKSEKMDNYKDKVKYFVTTRLGGVSKYPYESLNISFKNIEDRENSEKNLDIACDKLGFTRENAVCVFEDHTDKVVVITEENKDEFLFSKHHNKIYDAMITNVKNIPLVITIADCNAIVMYDTKNNVIANIHSGWKGTIQKIYLNVLNTMEKEFNTKPDDVICVYSPTIQECCWKTKDTNLAYGFQKYWEDTPIEEFVYTDTEGWTHVDFPYAITKDLIKAGIKEENIINENICTCCNVDTFFSYRKKTELNEPAYGVQASIIELI